jgi:aspartate/methionine/tyrosine aminotransferase
MALSARGAATASPSDGTLMWKILDDLWCPRSNPSGFVSLGVAENSLMHEKLSEHVHMNLDMSHHAFTYGDGSSGSKRLRKAIAHFLNDNFQPVTNVASSQITVTNGCSSALEHISWAIANPGDAFLLGKPFYGTFLPDLSLRTGAKVIPVSFGDVDPLSLDAVDFYENALIAARKGGQKIAGIVLCNPHNPLGRCYSQDVILRLMRLCQEYDMHLISDEIYALSVWENTVDKEPAAVPFQSCLAIDTNGLVDRSRIHMIWGMSKDFGANGLRLGAIISQGNPTLHAALVPVALYSSASSISDHVSADILQDTAWVQAYTAENRRKLSERYEVVTTWARENSITYAPGVNAAFFIWVNLGKAYQSHHPEAQTGSIDSEVMTALLEKRVFLASGKQFGSEWPGWFRIVFAHDIEYLERGLGRVSDALG